jgi:hypothetical protein
VLDLMSSSAAREAENAGAGQNVARKSRAALLGIPGAANQISAQEEHANAIDDQYQEFRIESFMDTIGSKQNNGM